jgi:hypothetical protein
MPVDEVIIRAAVPADAEALDALIRDLAAHEGASQLITFSPVQVATALAGKTPRLRALIAEDTIEPANHAALAFYRSLGVAIRDKVIARRDAAAMKAALANFR